MRTEADSPEAELIIRDLHPGMAPIVRLGIASLKGLSSSKEEVLLQKDEKI